MQLLSLIMTSINSLLTYLLQEMTSCLRVYSNEIILSAVLPCSCWVVLIKLSKTLNIFVSLFNILTVLIVRKFICQFWDRYSSGSWRTHSINVGIDCRSVNEPPLMQPLEKSSMSVAANKSLSPLLEITVEMSDQLPAEQLTEVTVGDVVDSCHKPHLVCFRWRFL